MQEEFEADVAVLQPSSPREDALGTVRVDVGDRRIHILFYEGGRLKLRINRPAPMSRISASPIWEITSTLRVRL